MNASAESTSFSRASYALWSLLALTLVLTAGSYWWSGRHAQQDQQFIRLVDRQQVLSQALARQALAAAGGEASAFQRLEAVREALSGGLAELGLGGGEVPAGRAASESSGERAAVASAWRTTEAAVAAFLATRDAVVLLWRRTSEFEAFAADTLLKSDELVNVMVETGASPEQVYAATRQLMLLERLGHNLRRTLTGGTEALEAAERFERDVVHFRQVTQGLLAGDDRLGIEAVADSEARALLADILAAMGGEEEEADAILTEAGALVWTRQAAGEVGRAADALGEALVAWAQAYPGKAQAYGVAGWLGHGFAVLAGILIVLVLFLSLRLRASPADAQQPGPPPKEPTDREQELREAERRSQAAVLRLLDEVNALADGDLDVTVTVTDESTGAVAQSVNGMAAKVRDLVGLARVMVVRIETAAEAARAAAAVLAEAGDGQSLQSRQVSALQDREVERRDKAASTGADLDALTQRLLVLAQEGTAMTTKVAQALDATREPVKEGTTGLERARARCREVLDLAGLVDDIADQARILALNTAIQASTADGSGSDLGMVADDVQRLTERLTRASQRIETLMSRVEGGIHDAMTAAGEVEAGLEANARLAREVRDVSAETGEKLQSVQGLARRLATLAGAGEGRREDAPAVPAGAKGTSERLLAASRDMAGRLAQLSDSALELKQILAEFRMGSNEVAPDDRALWAAGQSAEGALAGAGQGRQEPPATLGLREKARSG